MYTLFKYLLNFIFLVLKQLFITHHKHDYHFQSIQTPFIMEGYGIVVGATTSSSSPLYPLSKETQHYNQNEYKWS